MKRLTSLQRKYFSKFNIHDVNPNLIKAEYAVRGTVPIRAQQIAAILQRQKNGETGLPEYPFTSLTEANIGNPQTFGQPPISFNREVLSGILNPQLLKNGGIQNKDAKQRIEFYQSKISGNVGAYTLSHGYAFARQEVAEYIARRDGSQEKTDINNIILTNGASEGVNNILTTLISHPTDGVMIPIPQYPLYSALIKLLGGSQVNYYLEESQKFGTSMEQLEQSHRQSLQVGVKPKILCVINPGNPTGTLLTRENMEDMVKFAYEKNMLLLADEVYQQNIYTDAKFISFKQIVSEMPAPYNDVQLVSVHSTSKGLLGECGLRGGYMEMVNLDKSVYDQIVKLKSINLCSNSIGQLITECMVNHPRVGAGFEDSTVEQYNNEVNELFTGLQQRSKLLTEKLNKMTNIESQPAEAAMYAFPRIRFSEKAIQKAKEQNMAPDLYYCLQALEKTGIVLVPGSGFGQEEGTYHFRITNLIRPLELFEQKFEVFDKFNTEFHREHQ